MRKQLISNKKSTFLKHSQIVSVQFCFLICQNDRMSSPQILRPFISCYDTCSTNDASFIIGCCQVRFSVLISDQSANTYSALDVTHVSSALEDFSWNWQECKFYFFCICIESY